MAEIDDIAYVPERIQAHNVPDIVQQLQKELWRISAALDSVRQGYLPEFNVEPDRPRDGMIRFADGTNWNPGAGKGIYSYWDSAWRKLIAFNAGGVYGDYLVSGLSVARGTNAPDLETLNGALQLYAFAGTGAVTEQGFFTLHILHDIKDNSKPTFHVHWTHKNASPSGQVKWNIDYSIARGYQVDAYSTVTTLSCEQSASAQYVHHIAGDSSMTLSFTNIEPDCVIIGRIYRDPGDAADTFEDDAFLIQVDMHFEAQDVFTEEKNRPFAGYD